MISCRQLVINDNAKHSQARHVLNVLAWWRLRLYPASHENDLLSLCVVHLQFVICCPSLHVFNLHSTCARANLKICCFLHVTMYDAGPTAKPWMTLARTPATVDTSLPILVLLILFTLSLNALMLLVETVFPSRAFQRLITRCEKISDVFLTSWLTQFGQMSTYAFIITIHSKQRLKVNRYEPFIHLKSSTKSALPYSTFSPGSRDLILLICWDNPCHIPTLSSE